MSGKSKGIVLPAYHPDWQELLSYIERLQEEVDPDRIILELDEDEARELPSNVEVFQSERRRGKGAAISHGFDRLDTDKRLFADADGSVPPEAIERLLDSEADLVLGSRRHPESEIMSSQTPGRKLLGDIFSMFAESLLNLEIQDYQCGAKAVTAELWQDIGPRMASKDFSWDLELISRAYSQGYSVQEVPVTWEDREGSTVPISSTILEMTAELFRARRRLD